MVPELSRRSRKAARPMTRMEVMRPAMSDGGSGALLFSIALRCLEVRRGLGGRGGAVEAGRVRVDAPVPEAVEFLSAAAEQPVVTFRNGHWIAIGSGMGQF